MTLKTQVIDRIPTYPGRVTMTPVTGQTNTYDLARADSPIEEGTPINKALFDQKAYTLTESVTVYVSGASGSDVTGDGTATAPYATIQKAIDELPKCLGSYHALIDIAAGTYEERVTIDGFYGGRLTIGANDRTVTVRGISVQSSAAVRINVSNITYSANYAGTLLYAGFGSNVTIMRGVTFRGEAAAVNGIGATQGSVINAPGVTVAFLSFAGACILATAGSTIALETVEGNSNTSYGLRAERGAVISYMTRNLTATAGDSSIAGGRILTAGGSGTDLSPASVE